MKGVKSQSEVLSTILLIFIGIAAVVILFNVVHYIIEGSITQIRLSRLAQLEVRDVKLWVTGGAELKLRRDSVFGSMDAIKVIFYDTDGISHSIIINDSSQIPARLETKTVEISPDDIPVNNSRIDRILIYTMDEGYPGIESKESESAVKRDSSGRRILDTLPETVSWWRFDGNAGDNIGNNDGTLEGHSEITSAGELNLSASGDYVNVSSNKNLDIREYNWTISAWVKPANLNSVQYIVGKSDFSGDADGRYGLFLFTDKPAAMLDDGDEKSDISNMAITPDQWTYLTAVYIKGTNLTVYINGNPVSSTEISNSVYAPTAYPFQIGHIQGYPGYFKGLIDDVMIYQKALSGEQIKGIYYNQQKS